MRTDAFASVRVVRLLASLNRPLVADKVRDHGGCRRVEANHVEHAAVVRVGEGEVVGGHAHNDCLCVTDELAAILTQRLRGMNLARPRFAVRVGDERRHVQFVFVSEDYRQGAVRRLERQVADALHHVVQAHARRDVQRNEPIRESHDVVFLLSCRRHQRHRRAGLCVQQKANFADETTARRESFLTESRSLGHRRNSSPCFRLDNGILCNRSRNPVDPAAVAVVAGTLWVAEMLPPVK